MISFGEKTFFWLFPFFLLLFSCCRTAIELFKLFPTDLRPGTEKYILYPLVKAFLIMISNLLYGIPSLLVFIIHRKTKNEKNQLIRKKKQKQAAAGKTNLSLIKNATYKSLRSVKTYFIIFGITLLLAFFLPGINFLFLLDPKASQIGFSMNILLIIINSYFTHKVFNYTLFRHHVFAIGLCLLGIILVQLPGYISGTNNSHMLYVYLAFIAIQFLISCLDVTEKWLMENKFVSPWKLLFFMGLSGSVMYIIGFTILGYITCPAEWGSIYCDKGKPIVDIINGLTMNFYDYLWSCLLVISGSLYLLAYVLTNFYFTPTHKSLADIFTSFIFWIPTFTTGLEIVTLAGYLIAFVGSLIYNEIIILNFLKLDENTKIEINKRSKDELEKQTRELAFERNNDDV